jgi:hypothetical protein
LTIPMPCAFVIITIPILLFMSFNSVIIRAYKYQTRPTNFVTYVQANVVVEFFCLTARKSLQFKQIRNGRFWRRWHNCFLWIMIKIAHIFIPLYSNVTFTQLTDFVCVYTYEFWLSLCVDWFCLFIYSRVLTFPL